MSDERLRQILEAALLAAGQALSLERLRGLFPEEARPEDEALLEALTALESECHGRGIELREVASGYRFQVKRELSPWVSRLWEERPVRYSRALLETLALIAYRQPITRGEIEEIRGVSVSSAIVKALQEREWVRVLGHLEVPGRPAIYGTTRQFLDYFGLRRLEDLPTLVELRDMDLVLTTLGPAIEAGTPEEVPEEEPSRGATPSPEPATDLDDAD